MYEVTYARFNNDGTECQAVSTAAGCILHADEAIEMASALVTRPHIAVVWVYQEIGTPFGSRMILMLRQNGERVTP